ncbi:MAG: LemA family protein [Candidatus Micrarchaeia archaeon]
MDVLTIGLLVLGALVVVVVLTFIGMYNRFITLRNRIDNSWSQIDVQLKRRYDLIPNLVESVKGYAKHEKTTLSEVTKYRGQILQGGPKERMAANDALGNVLSRLMMVAENYPQLKANENFLKLQEELAGTENKISYVRTAYNDTVLEFNNATQIFPGSLVAGMFGFAQKPYLEAKEEERQAVKVKFD